MTARQRKRRLEQRRRRSLPRVRIGFDSRGRAIVMRRLHWRDLATFSAATRRQLEGISSGQAWHGGSLRVSSQTFGIFIGGQFAGVMELHVPIIARAAARIFYWLSTAFAYWGVASRAVMKFMDWAATEKGIKWFEVPVWRNGEITRELVDYPSFASGIRRLTCAVNEPLSSA